MQFSHKNDGIRFCGFEDIHNQLNIISSKKILLYYFWDIQGFQCPSWVLHKVLLSTLLNTSTMTLKIYFLSQSLGFIDLNVLFLFKKYFFGELLKKICAIHWWAHFRKHRLKRHSLHWIKASCYKERHQSSSTISCTSLPIYPHFQNSFL